VSYSYQAAWWSGRIARWYRFWLAYPDSRDDLTGSYFGLNSVLPGAALGALGFVLGCCFPKLGMKLARLLSEM